MLGTLVVLGVYLCVRELPKVKAAPASQWYQEVHDTDAPFRYHTGRYVYANSKGQDVVCMVVTQTTDGAGAGASVSCAPFAGVSK